MDEIPIIEPVVGEKELSNVESVLNSGYLTQGPYTEQLEESFADKVGVDHGIAVTSCTTGLELTLKALDIGAGDEVIVPDFTYPATGNAVAYLGADTVLADVDPETYNLDPESVREVVSADTAAILPVSWGGQPLDPTPLRGIADEYDLHIIEDAACSSGATYDGVPVGSQFDASVFSFHPRKVITTGEGGIITTDDDDLAERIRSIKNFGTDQRNGEIGFVRADGTNRRFSDVLAAIGVAQLEKLDDIVKRRRELAHRYDRHLHNIVGIVTPSVPDPAFHTYQSYTIFTEAGEASTRDELIDRLADRNIETQIGTYALHNTEAFADAKRADDLSTADVLGRNLLTLPVTHEMTEEDQKRVVTALDEELESFR